ncbi:MAG: hypothetical protein R3F30_01540 [Planctomycetota bacterium]
MNRPLRAASALALLLAQAPAQVTSYTSPTGLDGTEGNNYFYHWGSTTGRVLQVVDWSNLQPRAINQMAFRRDTTVASNTTSVSGTLDLVVVVAQCDYRNVDSVYAGNHTSNPRTAYSGKINFPDWRTKPLIAPANFDFVIKFNTTWTYLGRALANTQALVWTADYKNATNGYGYMDRDYSGYSTATGTPLGSGCGGFADYLQFLNSGDYDPLSGMHLRVRGTNAPPNAPIFLMFDGTDSNLTVPGLCARLRALPTFVFYMGPADGTGLMSDRYLTLPYIKALESGTLYTQLLTVDTTQAGLPFAVTGGQKVTVPSQAKPTNAHAACYHWSSGSGGTVSPGIFFSGAPIAEFR